MNRAGHHGGDFPSPAALGILTIAQVTGPYEITERLARRAFLLVGEPPVGEDPAIFAVQRFSTYRIMRRRVSGAGKRPRAAPMFSRMWSTLDVAGMAQVTAGWETMNLRKN